MEKKDARRIIKSHLKLRILFNLFQSFLFPTIKFFQLFNYENIEHRKHTLALDKIS